jgi:hypothetical protein
MHTNFECETSTWKLEDNIKMHDGRWIKLAQDRVGWRDFLLAELNFESETTVLAY